MDIQMIDVMVHIDEDLNKAQRNMLEKHMRMQDGVIALGYHDERPHLMIVEYNPECTSSSNILHLVKRHGYHAELIGM